MIDTPNKANNNIMCVILKILCTCLLNMIISVVININPTNKKNNFPVIVSIWNGFKQWAAVKRNATSSLLGELPSGGCIKLAEHSLHPFSYYANP